MDLAKLEQETTEQVEVQNIWRDLCGDIMRDKDKANKRFSIVCVIMALMMIAMAIAGFMMYDNQQTKYMAQIEALSARNEKQVNDFLEFLNEYELASYSQDVSDGGDANFIGRDGDITNGEPKDKDISQAER